MIIGIPKEVKDSEFRVGATPAIVRTLVDSGHQVFVESHAGEKIGLSDALYKQAGAQILTQASDVYLRSEMIIKVKEPQPQEYDLLKEGQILFTYLHLAPDPQQTAALLEKKVVGIAYETVTDSKGRLPLLLPMSEIAGRISIQAGATALQMINGGRGVLLGGVPGVAPAKVVVIGGGVAGTEAARMAMGLGADVTILDNNLSRLRELDILFSSKIKTIFSTSTAIEELVPQASLVIGSVLIPGKKAPHLISKELVKKMLPGSVIVDISIDQGGCVETAKPTTHSNPTYIVDHVVHSCVSNIPGACARSATFALTNATQNFILQIANKGYQRALLENEHLMNGLNVCEGIVTNEAVAHDLGYDYHQPKETLLKTISKNKILESTL